MKYNIKDIVDLLGLCKRCRANLYGKEVRGQKKIDKHCYSDEFQAWFASGIRRCDKHSYPFMWHIMERVTCAKCERGES